VVASPLDFVRNLLPMPARPPAHASGEVEELRRRVDELQARLAKHKKPARRAPKRRPKTWRIAMSLEEVW